MRARNLAVGASLLIAAAAGPARADDAIDQHKVVKLGGPDLRLVRRADVGAPPGEPLYWPAVAAYGFAATGFAMGLGFTMEAFERSESAERMLRSAASVTPRGSIVCPAGSDTPSCAHLAGLLEERRRYTKLAIASYAAGGLAGAVGLALTIWPLRGSNDRRTARIAPIASPQGGGLRVSGTF